MIRMTRLTNEMNGHDEMTKMKTKTLTIKEFMKNSSTVMNEILS